MKYQQLGHSDLNVSEICLGSMTWGSQNNEVEGHQQMDYAFGHGVNFIDCAEMYPTTPIAKETTGASEAIIGSWLQRQARDQVIVATKVCGAGGNVVRDGAPISADTIKVAVEGSLKRLQTDYIDLYQLHWPNRGSYCFRQAWKYQPEQQDSQAALDYFNETLHTLDLLVRAGKIRYIGLSNETCWGLMSFLGCAVANDYPKVISIQNEYNLLDRKFDLDLAEASHHEHIGLLAYSPLAAGLLSGKYRGDATPAGSRRSLRDDLNGRINDVTVDIVEQYHQLATASNMSLTQLALAFCLSRPFMASTIIGATNLAQLQENLSATTLQLDKQVLKGISAIHRQHLSPAG